MRFYHEDGMNWIGAKGRFRIRSDLVDALPQDYDGWKLMGIWLGIIRYSYPVILFRLCNSWKTSSCETYTMGGKDIEHFSVEGGRFRHWEGCFRLTRK